MEGAGESAAGVKDVLGARTGYPGAMHLAAGQDGDKQMGWKGSLMSRAAVVATTDLIGGVFAQGDGLNSLRL